MLKFIGEQLEEIVVQHQGNAHEQGSVQIGFLKDFIHIGAAARQLTGQPDYCLMLLIEPLSDVCAYMHKSKNKRKTFIIE